MVALPVAALPPTSEMPTWMPALVPFGPAVMFSTVLPEMVSPVAPSITRMPAHRLPSVSLEPSTVNFCTITLGA